MTRRLWIIIAALLVLPLGLLLMALTQTSRQSPTRRRLPDGSMLELVSVSFSTNISYRSPQPNVWKQAVLNVLPSWLAHRLGLFRAAGAITMSNRFGETNLAIFTACGEVVPNYFSSAELEAADENGNTFAITESKGSLFAGSSSGRGSRIDAWVLAAFPRRGKTIHLRFLLRDPVTHRPTPVAQFVIPNPAPALYPVWAPETIPVMRHDGDLMINLVSFVVREKPLPSSAQVAESKCLELAFDLQQKGTTNHSWRPKSVEFTDATGNHWVPFPDALTSFGTDRLFGLRVDGALWPGETAWKARVEFSRTNDFSPDELWTIGGVPVPAPTEAVVLGAATNLHGARLQLIAISGPDAEQPGNLRWGTVKSLANISIRVTPLPEDRRLTLVAVRDEQGRQVRITPSYEGRSSEMVYGLSIPEGATELQLTFALHQSRFVEFLVRPASVLKSATREKSSQ
jgi:hypothetical protein